MALTLRSTRDAADQKITHAVVCVTPDMAKRWIAEHNTNNRPISASRVSQYVGDMNAGRWHFNGETIQFDRHGVLLNGQHRLLAIIETGIAQSFLIVRGLEPQSQLTMDQGTRRTPKDQLHLAGIVMDNSMAAAVRVFIQWQTGRLFGDQTRNKVTTAEVVEWAQRNPELVDAMRDLTSAGVKRAKCHPSVALAIALRLALIDETDCRLFFGTLTSAEMMTGPILALSRRLDNVRDAGAKLTARDTIGYFVTAWNAYRAGRDIGRLQKPRNGVWTVENFPEPI